MKSPELQIIAQNKVSDIIGNLTTIDDCGYASNVIDFYQKDFPEDKEFTQQMRDFLCDRTFELYNKRYNS